MIIGIDGSRAFMEKRTGIEEYSYQVISHLRDKLEAHRVVLYVRKNQNLKIKSQKDGAKIKTESNSGKEDVFLLPSNWEVKVINFPRFWTQIGLSWELFFHPVDVLFVPAHTVPVIHPKKTIVTVHGLEYEIMPEAYSFWERLYMRWSIRNSCKWAKKIISVSSNTKQDLINLYKILEEKIFVVHEGTKQKFPIFNSQFPIESVNMKYLLFIGRLEKRKNVLGIIEAFEKLKEKYEIPHKLVLAGKPGYDYESIKDKISNSKYRKDIIETGYISEEKKWQLLKNADIFLFPTFYEGFGIPVLEAQSVGTPVVTSNVSSLPEVAGEGAFFADPSVPEFISEATHQLISDKKKRDDIISKGMENIKRFSWEKCAEQIADLLLSFR